MIGTRLKNFKFRDNLLMILNKSKLFMNIVYKIYYRHAHYVNTKVLKVWT